MSRDSDFSSRSGSQSSRSSSESDDDFSDNDKGASRRRQDKYDRKNREKEYHQKDYSSDSDIEVTHKGAPKRSTKESKSKYD